MNRVDGGPAVTSEAGGWAPRLLLGAGLAYAVGYALVLLFMAPSGFDFPWFIEAARTLAERGDLYDSALSMHNGPALAVLLLPLTPLGDATAAVVWAAIGLACTLGLAVWLGRQVGRRDVVFVVSAFALLLLTLPVRHALGLGQVTVQATLLAALAWSLSARGRRWEPWLAAACLWLAFELKPNYVWVVVLLLVAARRWRPLWRAALIVAVEQVLLFAWNPANTWLGWTGVYFLTESKVTNQRNQSGLNSVFMTWLAPDAAWGWVLGIVLSLTAVTAAGWWTRRHGRDQPELTLALWLAVIPLASPYAHPQDAVPALLAACLLLFGQSCGRVRATAAGLLAVWCLDWLIPAEAPIDALSALRVLVLLAVSWALVGRDRRVLLVALGAGVVGELLHWALTRLGWNPSPTPALLTLLTVVMAGWQLQARSPAPRVHAATSPDAG